MTLNEYGPQNSSGVYNIKSIISMTLSEYGRPKLWSEYAQLSKICDFGIQLRTFQIEIEVRGREGVERTPHNLILLLVT